MMQQTMSVAEASQAYWKKHENGDGSFYLLGPYTSHAAMSQSFLRDLQEQMGEEPKVEEKPRKKVSPGKKRN
jgi:hypothetical protein